MTFSLRRSVFASGLLLLLCLQLHRSEGHITFFSPKEMMIMKEREGKKDMEPRSEDGQLQDASLQPQPETEHNAETAVALTLSLSPQQLDHVAPVLELIQEMVEERQKAK